MEFDNDRIIPPPNRIELFYWLLLGIINPLVSGLTFFLTDFQTWLVLFLVNLALLPAYVLYARLIVPRFFFQNKNTLFIFISFSFFILVQLVLFAVCALVFHVISINDEKFHFLFTYRTVIIESLWVIINISVAVAIAYIRKTLDEKELLFDLQKENSFLKVRYLRAQLNPHFLFNTLNSIYSLSLQKSDKTPEVVIKLSDIMRYMTYECNQPRIELTKEIDFIQNYIDIEKLRHNADVRFSVEGDTKGIMIEPFLFLPFIENGFKHAFDTSFSNTFIYITIKVQPDQIVLNVINNTNLDLETQAKRINGMSMQNSKTLLELLYPGTYELDIIQTEKEESRSSSLRIKNARDRLEILYPDSHTLDVILSNNVFTVSLIIKNHFA
ncbi:sensor histidine kinase [Danxiaibacter flavus]|uniref:Sensor histidine kinase n=1 Tax=Danxiaibacter flavus TaxID=3049108 RepID=A0ABV3ZFK9_9BACT|nr:sensor histidine kinase [Chitinophagaceae bacterium DXS]